MKKFLKGFGLFIGGFILGGVIMSSGEEENVYSKEEPTKVVEEEVVEENTEEVVEEVVEEPKEIQALKIFEDKNVNAFYYSTENDITKIIIENKTNVAIGVQDQTFGVNGFSTTSNTDSISVAPNSKGIIQIDLAEISGMYGTPSNISGEISVFNNDSYDNITSIKFSNITIQ